MNYPTLSVLDNTDPTNIVVWHVQTDPATPAGTATGAWILGEREQFPISRLSDLLQGTVIVATPGSTIPESGENTSIESIRQSVESRLKEYNEHGIRLPALNAPVEATFGGEPAAESAWRTAMELVQLVAGWHEIESARRSRKVLAEAFGAEVAPLPL